MTTTNTAVTVNRATEFANWLLNLIGGDRIKAANVCLECLLQSQGYEEDRSRYPDFVGKCQSRADAFVRERNPNRKLTPFDGLKLFVQDQLYQLWIPTEGIRQLLPSGYEEELSLIGIPECDATYLIATIEDATGERAELEEELRLRLDKQHQDWWERRATEAAAAAFGRYEIPPEEVLSNLEKLIALWRDTRKRNSEGRS